MTEPDPKQPAGRWRRLADSLLFRMMLFGVFMVVLGSTGRSLTLKVLVREHVESLAAANQLAIANYIARDIELKVVARQRLLERLARELPPALLERPRDLQAWLAERQQFEHPFSSGLLVAPANGEPLIAEYPELPGRKQLRFADQGWFSELGSRSGPLIIKPIVSPVTAKPVLGMGVYIKDADGRRRAVLIGVTDLLAADMLGAIPDSQLGASGSFLVISPADKVFVVGSDPAFTLKATPPPGVNALHDSAMAGFRGTGVTVNAFGIEELSAIAAIPSTGWFVVARMPTSEALSVVEKVQRHIVIGGIISALILFVLVGTYLRLVLRPMREAAEKMLRMADGAMALQRLPIARHDEVGSMIASFNCLADRLNANEAALRERSNALEQALGDLHESEARMAHMAHHDSLTGLPNRALFQDRLHLALARAQRSGKAVALLFLDLDGFKPVNDTHGHEIGDEVLRQLAERLAETVRRADTVARLGGDEFVILLDDLDDPRAIATAIAAKCLEAVAADFLVDTLRLSVGLSIGIAIYPSDADGPAALLSRADQAMYVAKQNGRGRYEFFQPQR
jgi:diguanylate cyclase (GGDEF)-like protein